MFATFRDLPIRHKLMRVSMLVSTSVLLLASLSFIIYELVTFRSTMVNSLSSQAEIVGLNTVSAVLFNDPASAVQTMTALRIRPNIVSAAIYTAEGRMFARYVRNGEKTVPEAQGRIIDKKASHHFDENYLYLSQPMVSDGEIVGMVYIQSDLTEMDVRMKRYALIVAGVLGISLLAAYGVSSMLQGRISGPILQLARTAKSVSEDKNYSIRASAASRDEIGQLVHTFNEMLTQIQVREDALQKAHDKLEERVQERTGEIIKLNEDLRVNAARLEAANKELEAFSYSVSHDLRSPLRHLDGFSQILLEDYAEKLDDQGRHYLQQLQEASRKMAQLIDDLLNLSRVTRAELRREKVDLSGIVQTVAEELKKDQPDRAVEFVIEKGVTVEADARLLRVVIDNFLGNAWKYSGKRPQPRIEFGRAMREGKPAYFIRDNGAGFDMAYADKLFGAFQRLHAAAEFPGTGIGLATAQRIIRRHGGEVWAEGVPDQGATFYFTI